jgi:chemotaxis protein CheD
MSKAEVAIDVPMSGMKVDSGNAVMRSTGIGSCIVITLYDSLKKIGAMAHPMIAMPKGKKFPLSNLRYVENAIHSMVQEMEKAGANKKRLESKIFGGAHMFKVFDSGDKTIGMTNVNAAKRELEGIGIPIVANDTGGNVGRSVHFDLATGLVDVKMRI